MDDVPQVDPTVAPRHPAQRPEEHPEEQGTRAQQRRKRPRTPDWWRTRNVLGVLNWELVLIVAVALVAGVVATIGSSIVGVR